MRVVVEGCGPWAMEYRKALGATAGSAGVIFTYDSTFGVDSHAERLDAELYVSYLQNTLENVEVVRKAGFACLDTKDTLHRLQGRRYAGRDALPYNVDVVFVTTPDRTHCDVATFWLGRARRIFVEKPFDVSAHRISMFCREMAKHPYTEVFAVDHYFMRCNQAAAQRQFFLSYLLGDSGNGTEPNDITSFEFCLTEAPARDPSGRYTPEPTRRRALSLQAGMAFDLGAHALPLLIPFIDLDRTITLQRVWAGVSEPLRSALFSGAESFSRAEVMAYTRRTEKKPSHRVAGTFTVGKDIGDRPAKYLTVTGPGGTVRFDLVRYSVSHTSPVGHVEPIVALYQDWALLFVQEVVDGRTPAAARLFAPRGAVKVVRFLESWRAAHRVPGSSTEGLPLYDPGATLSDLTTDAYLQTS